MRNILAEENIHPSVREKVDGSHRAIVDAAKALVENGGVVVFGMGQNPHCRKIRSALTAGGVSFVYQEYGSYLGEWRPRTAIKMWTGWPTFPMVFVDGCLVGGASDAIALLESGELKKFVA
jgi:glutaredoxin-related protein